MARLAALVLCVILAACAPVTAPLGLQAAAPVVADGVYTTRDGLSLPLRQWTASEPHAVIVALHGMNDYSNAFDMPASSWAKRGITTYAYDQRGFGRAPHIGLWPGSEVMQCDLTDFVAAVKNRHPATPIFVLGESMGGAVVLISFAAKNPPPADGIILVAPAVWSRADMPLHYRMALWLTAHLAPGMTVTGKGLKIWPSDNIEMLRKFSRDPLVIKGTRSDAVWGLANLMDDARLAAGHLNNPPPILLLYGEKDQIIPRAPTEAVAKTLGTAATVHVYPKGYHMLLRDLNGPEAWNDVEAWIAAKTQLVPASIASSPQTAGAISSGMPQ